VRVIHFATTSIMLKAFILPLARWQREQGLEVEFGSGEDIQPGYQSAVAELEAAGFRVHVVPFPYHIRPLADAVALVRLWRFLRRERFDVVHTHASKAGILVRAAAWLARCPRIVHTIYILHFRKYQRGLRRAVFAWLERAAAQRTDALFCIGPVIRDEAVRERIAPAERLRAIGGPLGDLGRFAVASEEVRALRSELGLPDGAPVVACVCRLVDYKGVDTLLRAAPRVLAAAPQARFVVMGGGPLEQELRGMAAALGVADRVILTGFRPDDRDVLRLLALATVFCLPTRYDTYPIAFAEAMAMGLPVVGPRMDTVESMVADGTTGLLVAQNDDAAYADAIVRLLGDASLRTRLGEAARRWVRETMDPVPMYEAVTASYTAPSRAA
jgi:glycosyltransferase involved in cell wall biosynthesis